MLEGLLKWAVDYMLKDYVIIDPNSAKTNILEGKIEFENLELRPDILDKVGVPGYSLRAGSIGKLLVHVSPFSYASQPANVSIDGVYLLVVPSHVVNVDKKTKTARKVEDKLRTLAKIEEMRTKKLEADESEAEAQNKKDGFLLRQVMAIVRNLQITISNIHVRLEDGATDPSCKVSLGLSLESLTLRTCNEKWEERVVTESSDVFYKVAKLRSLALYFTTHSKLYSEQGAADKKTLKGILKSTIAREGGRLPPAYEYLVKPLSSDAKVWVVPNPRRCKPGQAQLYLDMVIHDVALAASKTQVHAAIALVESADLLRMKNKYKKFRPDNMSSPKTKWKFALECILVKTVRPKHEVWKWSFIKQHRDTCKKYQQVMEKIYTNSNYKLTEAEEAAKAYAEEKLNVFSLDVTRRLAQQSVKLTKEALAKEQKKKKQEKSGGGWFGWGSSKKVDKESPETKASTLAVVDEEFEKGMNDPKNKAELYKALGYDDSEDSGMMNYSLMPKEFVQVELGVGLKRFSVALFEDIGGGVHSNVAKISMSNLQTSLMRQPTPDYLKARFELGRLDIEGSIPLDANLGTTKPPQLLSMVDSTVASKSLMSLVFEMNPLTNSDVDFAIAVRSQSVQMTYDFATVQRLVDFFVTKQSASLVADDVKDAAERQMKKFSSTSTAGVLYLLEKHKVIFLDVDLEPSFALIPAEGTIRPDASLVIFKTGNLKVVTQNTKKELRGTASSAQSDSPSPKRDLSRSTTFDAIKDKPYDRYNCTLSNVQLFFMEKSHDWKSVAFNPDSTDSLVKPIKLTLDLQKCLVTDDPEFPVIKVSGALQDLSVRISDLKMIHLMIFLKELKFPSTNDYVALPTSEKAVSIHKRKPDLNEDALQFVDEIDSLLPLRANGDVDASDSKRDPTKQLTLLKLKYTIHKMSILLLEDIQPQDAKATLAHSGGRPLMSVELNNLHINLLKKTFEIPINLSLESISLTHLQIKHGSDYLKFLESRKVGQEESKQLVEVFVRIAERKSPIFATEYESVEFQVKAKVNALGVRLHQEAILSALEFQQSLFERLFPEDQNQTSEDEEEIFQQQLRIPLEGSEEPYTSKLEQYNEMFARERKTRLVQLQFWASVGDIDVAVSSDSVANDIALIQLAGLKSFVEVVPSETVKFQTSMENFNVQDPIGTMYPNIFSVRGSEVFALDVTYFFTATKGQGYLDMNKCDLSLKLKTGQPRVVYVHRWVNSLLGFATNFQEAKKRLEEVGSSVARNTADLAQTVYDKAFRIKLDLDISAPSLIVPKNSKSDQVMYANLGHMHVFNSFKSVPVETQNAILDSLMLELKDVKVSRALLNQSGDVQAECHLLEPAVMKIDLVRNLTPLLNTAQSGLEVNGKLERLNTCLGQADVQMVFEILMGNFGEVEVAKKPVVSGSVTPKRSRSRRSSRQGKYSKQNSRASSVHSGGGERNAKVSPGVGNVADDDQGLRMEKTADSLTTLKASFAIESICAQLFSDKIVLSSGLVQRDPNSNLAKFELLAMNVNAEMFSDGNLNFNANMMDCVLDDSRKISSGAIVRMMQRKKKAPVGAVLTSSGDSNGGGVASRLNTISEVRGSNEDLCLECVMISLEYRKEKEEEKIDMELNDVYLCVCTDFLMTIAEFFLNNRPAPVVQDGSGKLEDSEKLLTAPLQTIVEESAEDNQLTLSSQSHGLPAVAETENAGIQVTRVISVSFRDPEIVLVSDTRNDYSPCLILTWKVRSSIVMRGLDLKLTALITDVELLCCPFKHELRKGNTKQVIPKFNLQAFANQSESSKQQNMNIDIDELDINISPAVIKIMQAVAAVMVQHQSLDSKEEAYGVTDSIWAPKQVTEADVAFLKAPLQPQSKIASVDVVPASEVTASESAFLMVPRIVVKLDVSDSTGITQPIWLIESSLSARINNYISTDRLQILTDFSIGMEYFNSRVNAWEPVIEPNRFLNDKGKAKNELWSVRTELTHNSVNPENSVADSNPAEWLVEISAQKSLEMTVTSEFLNCSELIKEAFASSFTLDYKKGEATESCIGDEAPYAIVNESGNPLSVLLPSDFTVIGHETTTGPDDTTLVHLAALDKIELVPNANMSAAKVRRLSSRGSFSKTATMAANIGGDAGEEDESMKVKFHIIVPGSQTINDVSLTKPGNHFYNILPPNEYKFSLVVHNSLNSTGHQNVCTISSPLLLQNHFDIPFDVFDGSSFIGSVEPKSRFSVPMMQAFYPCESKLYVKPRGAEGRASKWGFSERAIDWRLIKAKGGPKRVLLEHCNVDAQQSKVEPSLQPLRMILQLETVQFGTVSGRLQDTPHYTIHMKPTCILRNLSPYPIYHRVKTAEGVAPREYRVLMYGEQEVLHEVVLGTTKIDIDVTDQSDKRYYAFVTMRRVDKSITHGQFYLNDKSASLVMGVSWEYDSANFLVASLFAPYWIINRLDRDLYIKRADDDKVQCHPRSFNGISIFTPSHKDHVDKIKLCVRVDNTLFSDSLNIQAVGNAEVAVCPRRSGGDLLVGVTNSLSNMGLTKIVVVTPNYILLNNTKYSLEYSQYFPNKKDEQVWSSLPETGVVGIWPSIQDSNSDNKRTLYLMLKVGNSVSKPFFITRADEFLVRMPEIGCLHISVSVSESATTITVNTYFPGAAPVKLFNLTDRPVLLWQSQNPADDSQKTYVLAPDTHMLFTWSDPAAERSLCYKVEGQLANKKGKKDTFFDLAKDEFQEVECEQLVAGDADLKNKKYYAASMLCRQQRVLIFTDDQCLATGTKEQRLHEVFTYDATLQLYGLALSLVNNTLEKELPKEIFYMGVTPTDVTWLYYGKGKKYWTSFSNNNITKIEAAYQAYLADLKANNPKIQHLVTLQLGSFEHKFDFSKNPIELLLPDKRKIKRTYLHGLSLHYQQSPNVTHFHFKMNRLQIDDPLSTCMFPVVFAPVPPPKSVVGDREPAAFVQASIVMQRGSGQLILFKYFKVLVQEFSIKLDATFLGALLIFFKGNQIKTQVQQYLDMDVELAQTQLADTEAVQIARGTQRHYYQDLNFGPIKMLLSLSLSRGANDDPLLQTDNTFIDGITQTLGVVLTEQHDTCIKLSYFERKNRFMTVKQLQNQAQKFYTNQVVRQFYYFFANLDALGNPQKLFLGFKEGGTDLFYEPYQGAILGPAEFVEGLGLGVKSLGSHAIGGVFGVASSVTASAGQAIAYLSFDEKHKQDRRNDMRDKPQHVGQGLTKGFKRFGSGLLGGVTGVVTQPMEGVKKDGAKGLFTGIGKGAAGLVVKPVGGVVDLASNTFEGIRGSADDAVVVGLLRTPRVVRSDTLVRPYDSYEASGNAILAALQKPSHRYDGHVLTHKNGKSAIIVTDKGLIHAEKRALVQAFDRWEVVSMFLFRDIRDIPETAPDDDQFKIDSFNDKKQPVSKVLTVPAANKPFLRQRSLQSFESFKKMKANNAS